MPTLMKYYYLNAEKKPQGPYSEAELLTFKESGLINDDSLAAVAGDSKWRPLREVLGASVVEVQGADCSTWNKELGNCPHCAKMIEGSAAPEQCPHCQLSLHGASKGLWYAFIYAIRNSFNYRGRATRTEFWGFFLFSYIISFVFNQIAGLFIQADSLRMEQAMQTADGNQDLSLVWSSFADFFTSPAVLTVQILSFILGIALFIPQLAVTARRLHDCGHSMVGLVVALGSYLVCIAAVILASFAIFASPAIFDSAVDSAGAEILAPYFYTILASVFVLCWSSLYLFIMMLLPGKPGANKYGPSVLYPNK